MDILYRELYIFDVHTNNTNNTINNDTSVYRYTNISTEDRGFSGLPTSVSTFANFLVIGTGIDTYDRGYMVLYEKDNNNEWNLKKYIATKQDFGLFGQIVSISITNDSMDINNQNMFLMSCTNRQCFMYNYSSDALQNWYNVSIESASNMDGCNIVWNLLFYSILVIALFFA